MMRMILQRGLPLALVASLIFGGWLSACPFCTSQGQTLVGELNLASMVLYGTFSNARLDASGDGQGTTDFEIEAVIKKHEILGDKKILTLPRYVPNKDAKVKFLVFCDVFKGKIDPYRGIPVAADSDMVKYLKGALAAKDKKVTDRLRFAFDYLDNKESEISNDAYKEFGNADYKDFREMAKNLPAERIVQWLEDPNTPAFRYGLYGSMLGHSGRPEHAQFLRKLLEDPGKRLSSGVDGVLAGYAMLAPKEGWKYLHGVLKDAGKEFMFRYAALRAVRFFWDSRTDVIPKDVLVKGVCELLEQSDIADLAVEDLRKWARWEVCDKILALPTRKSHDIPIIRRFVLRYALSCPEPKAAAFVDSWRKKDAEMVKDIEELLKLETTPPAPDPAKAGGDVAAKPADTKK